MTVRFALIEFTNLTGNASVNHIHLVSFFTFFLLNCLFFPANHVKEKNGRYVTVNIHKISVSKQINATGVTYEQQKTKET